MRGPCDKELGFKQWQLRGDSWWLTKQINVGKASDMAAWLTRNARLVEEAALENCSRHLHVLLKGMGPPAVWRDFRLVDDAGRPAASDREERI